MNQSLDKQLGLKVEIWKSLIWRMRETRQYSGKIDNHTSVNIYLRPRRKRQTDERYYIITSIGGNPVPCKIISSKHLVDKNHVWQTKNHVLLNLIGSINYKKHHFFKFVYFWEKESIVGEGQRERGTEDVKQVLSWQQRALCRGLTHKQDHNLSQSLTLNRLSHPGAPEAPLFYVQLRNKVTI